MESVSHWKTEAEAFIEQIRSELAELKSDAVDDVGPPIAQTAQPAKPSRKGTDSADECLARLKQRLADSIG